MRDLLIWQSLGLPEGTTTGVLEGAMQPIRRVTCWHRLCRPAGLQLC